jgi:paraquat-inducible protein B
MTTEVPEAEDLPEALLDERPRVSLVWLIPLVALFAALWLGYHAYREQGPLVTVAFQTAEGLEAGKTRVRFKDVDIGVIESIALSADLGGVEVQARLRADVTKHLNDNTRFWVVRPRFSGGQISGLGTLVGGVFVAVDLAADGNSAGERREFVGLESPPIVNATDRGRAYTLRAGSLGSLSIGSPVLFRGIEVGRVTGYELRDPHGIDVQIFVDAPHDAKVGTATRFWNASGVSMSLDAQGVRLHTDSIASVLLGGISFGTPDGLDPGKVAGKGHAFRLYDSRQAALERQFMHRQTWSLAFDGSVRGLLPGAPVEFRGIRIGEVLELELKLDVERRHARIPITIAIEPERLGLGAQADDSTANEAFPIDRVLWQQLVDKGLRAQLKTANLVTGALYVDLDFYPDDPPQSIAWDEAVPRLPTVPTPLDELRNLLTRLARLPLDRMGEDLSASLAAMRETIAATNKLLKRLDRETASVLSKTLAQTRRTLAGVEQVLKPNSPLQSEAHRALRELGSAARSLRIMADYLERHPEALLRGKGAVSP